MADATKWSGLGPTLENLFRSCGLGDLELRTYECLLQTGGARAADVVRQTGQSRPRAYEVLRSLVEKGLARPDTGRPVRFHPVPPNEALHVFLADLESQTRILRLAATQLAESRPAPAAPPVQPMASKDVNVIVGRRAVAGETRRILQAARQRFMMTLGSPAACQRLWAQKGLTEILDEMARRPVDIAVYCSERSHRECEALLNRRLQREWIRIVEDPPNPSIQVVANESTLILVVVQPDDASTEQGEDIGTRFSGRPVVEAFRGWLESSHAAWEAKRAADIVGMPRLANARPPVVEPSNPGP